MKLSRAKDKLGSTMAENPVLLPLTSFIIISMKTLYKA